MPLNFSLIFHSMSFVSVVSQLLRGLDNLVVACCTTHGWVLGLTPAASRDTLGLLLDSCFIL